MLGLEQSVVVRNAFDGKKSCYDKPHYEISHNIAARMAGNMTFEYKCGETGIFVVAARKQLHTCYLQLLIKHLVNFRILAEEHFFTVANFSCVLRWSRVVENICFWFAFCSR